jgi:predicted HTH transcriptional regulator
VESETCWTHCADPRTTLEFKRDLSSPEGLLRTVVAFANTARPGRFDGTNRATIADYAEFNGSLLAGIEQAIAFI